MEREKIIELFLGLIFFVFLLLVVFVVLSLNVQEKDSSKQTVVNNYYTENTYQTQEKSATGNVVYKYPEYKYVVYNRYRRNCCSDYQDSDDDYSSYGKHRKEKDGSRYVDEYSVSIRNEDRIGKYFQVIFYFEDSSEFRDSESINKWVGSGDVENFIYRDSHFERNNYDSWAYDIFSQDDGFEEELYESNSRTKSFHNFPSIGCR